MTASPISAAVVLRGHSGTDGRSYLTLLPWHPGHAHCRTADLHRGNFLRLKTKRRSGVSGASGQGEVRLRGSKVFELKPHAKRSVLLFLIGIVAVMFYATAISDTVGLIQTQYCRARRKRLWCSC
ncbi:hypothetical protein ACLK1Y_23250 [Escherichia coli]